MTRPNADETDRWVSEGGATPRGPATHVPAVERKELRPELAPPTSPNPKGRRRVGHVSQASDAPVQTSAREDETQPPPGQEEQ